MALIFAVLTLTLLANQVASGLALSIFGVGLSAFIGKPYESVTLPAVPALRIPLLADIPVLGPALFNQQALVYVSWALFAGDRLVPVPEPAGARAARRRRVAGVGALDRLSRSSGSATSPRCSAARWRAWAARSCRCSTRRCGSRAWSSGRGWIALALVVFATWRPLRVLVGAYLFGGVMIAQLFVQGSGAQIEIPSQFLSSLPYWATIIVLVVISRNVNTIRLNSPASLGQPYRPDA